MRSFIFGALLGVFGAVWALGALPGPIETFLNSKVCQIAGMAGLEMCGDDTSQDGDGEVSSDISPSEASSGNGTASGSSFETADALRRGGVFEDGHLIEVYTCPGMEIRNPPFTSPSGKLSSFKPIISVQGVSLAVAPISHGCFSSGYGTRNGKLHKGVDYHSEAKSYIYSAGSGTVVEAVYRDDYGNMVVVDHGNGVYTRYAHLKNFASGITEGKSVTGTTKLGRMGQSAGYKVVVHLHFEVLLGDFNTAAKSFGLEPTNPMGY